MNMSRSVLVMTTLFLSSGLVMGSSLTLSLTGHIKNYCEINFNDGKSLDFSNEIQKSLPFDIQCNQPLSMSVYSRKGGLENQQSNVRQVVAYEVGIDIETIGLKSRLHSQDIASPIVIDSSSVIPFDTVGVMRVTLKENLLYAGYYEDVIEIDVFPSIHGSSK